MANDVASSGASDVQFAAFRWRVRWTLIYGSFLLPLVTGGLAVFMRMENPWTGFVQPFWETFADYAIPFPVAAGCLQVFAWPPSIGVVLLLTLIRNWVVFRRLFSIWLVAYAVFVFFAIDNSLLLLYVVVDGVSVMGVVLFVFFSFPRVGGAPDSQQRREEKGKF